MLLLASRQLLKLISPLQPLFSKASLVLAGAWPLPRVPKEKAYSRKVGAGNGTVCPHLTLNPITAGAPELEAPRSFPEHPGISGLSC